MISSGLGTGGKGGTSDTLWTSCEGLQGTEPRSSKDFLFSFRTSLSVKDLLRKRDTVEAVWSSMVDFGRGPLLVIFEGLVRRLIKSGRLFHAEGGIVVRGFEAMSYGLDPRRSATFPKSFNSG